MMQVDVKLNSVVPEDKAVVKMYDDKDMDLGGEVTLDSTTSQTTVTVPPGGRCTVAEYKPPIVYNPETCGAEYEATPEEAAKKKADVKTNTSTHKEHSSPKATVPPASPRPKY